jgi:hypothetical protein
MEAFGVVALPGVVCAAKLQTPPRTLPPCPLPLAATAAATATAAEAEASDWERDRDNRSLRLSFVGPAEAYPAAAQRLRKLILALCAQPIA